MTTRRSRGYPPRFPLQTAIAVTCLIAAMQLAAMVSTALAQDILIVRPLNNSSTVATDAEIVFEVNVSSFAPIIEVKINGEVQPLEPSPTVNIRKQLKLDKGNNTILVEVATEFETAEKEFEIRLGKLSPEDLIEHFQLVTIIGQENVSNPLKFSAASAEVPGTRQFLVLVPRYDWFPDFPDDNHILRLQMIISRDKYDDEALAAEEVAFTQLTFSWLKKFGGDDLWKMGTGYNLIYSGYDNLFNGLARKAYDNFVFANLRIGYDEKSAFEFGLEYKQQIFVDEPEESLFATTQEFQDAVDNDEDATITTLRFKLETPAGTFKNIFSSSYATFATDGKFKEKTQIRLSDELRKAYGSLIFGFGGKIKQNDFKAPNPEFDDQAPSERLISLFATGTWVIFKSWIVVAEAVIESQTSNVVESEYDNNKIGLSTIFAF